MCQSSVTPLVSGTETWKQQAEKTGAKQGIEFHKIQPKLDWTATSLFLPNVAHTTQTEAESALPLPLLADTSLPILFYKMIPLYFDDLGDSGIVDLHCRVRVMPTFWFLLVRLVVRVDEVLIRCIDHRFFHEFGKKYISSETSLFEAAWSKLRSPLTHDALNASHGADLLTNEHRRFHMCRRFNL
ncbi:MAG: uncharacterized protein KVP18_001036 [Porospora cf. gigantea A]|uniref:uncharacterized protein n=1 Tax=Porospora cf. gigantea A TaxID=2853593 RepID=UPI0035594492|nr:MAG: hypothetical protein KVP18_001036 [Porospora cf. gigantea A]